MDTEQHGRRDHERISQLISSLDASDWDALAICVPHAYAVLGQIRRVVG